MFGVDGWAIKPEYDEVTVAINGSKFLLTDLEGTVLNLFSLNWSSFGICYLQ